MQNQLPRRNRNTCATFEADPNPLVEFKPDGFSAGNLSDLAVGMVDVVRGCQRDECHRVAWFESLHVISFAKSLLWLVRVQNRLSKSAFLPESY